MTTENNNTDRDWNREPVDFFDASPTQRQLYVQAYNELQKKHPNTPIPLEIIRERMQEITNRNSPAPMFIWTDCGDLANLETRGYANYFAKPYREGDEMGPSDGESIRYMRLDTALGFALVKQLDGRSLTDAEKALLGDLHDILSGVKDIIPKNKY